MPAFGSILFSSPSLALVIVAVWLIGSYMRFTAEAGGSTASTASEGRAARRGRVTPEV